MLGATYIGPSSMRHVHNLMKSQSYTHLGSENCLLLPLLVVEFGKVCTQFKEKTMHFVNLV